MLVDCSDKQALNCQVFKKPGLDSQAFAALSAARVNHSAATAGFHANQETMGTGATDFGRLVSAFHLEIPMFEYRKAFYYRKFIQSRQHLSAPSACNAVSDRLCGASRVIALWINSG
jgi:hypothetical protein